MEVTVSSGDMAAILLAGGVAANDRYSKLYPLIPKEKTGAAVLQVKLNRYKCGGLIIGILTHHRVSDGQSFSSFLAKWAMHVRADHNDGDFAAPPPFLDRAATAVPRSPPMPVFDHRSVEFNAGDDGHGSRSYAAIPTEKIKNLTVSFTAQFVAAVKLKARVGGGAAARCSTFQCLLAHVWKKVTAARGLSPGDFTQVKVAVNCTRRAELPVPADFLGNMVLWAFPRLRVGELLTSSYGRVVTAIRDAVARVDAEVLCPDLEVDSWLGFQFHQTDFGTGPPCAFLAPDIPVDGLMVFVPSGTARGGVDLFIGLVEGHIKEFHKICYVLD
ncbi:hypothetical protein C2845_PM13G05380 [Panicum miliaceum]|uniref:Agmatine coumaroyltransferase-2-like n=1 Tax=Panicum miliaceum TaxID=4540 RepID=A0A3L6RH42_PANMI|nr:hypothetical protein C2845_PM13G05380 [Panicum miliaceum]